MATWYVLIDPINCPPGGTGLSSPQDYLGPTDPNRPFASLNECLGIITVPNDGGVHFVFCSGVLGGGADPDNIGMGSLNVGGTTTLRIIGDQNWSSPVLKEILQGVYNFRSDTTPEVSDYTDTFTSISDTTYAGGANASVSYVSSDRLRVTTNNNTNDSAAAKLANNEFFYVDITANAGESINLTELSFSTRREGNSPDRIQVSISDDGGSTWTTAITNVIVNSQTAFDQTDVDLKPLTQFADASSLRIAFIFYSGATSITNGQDDITDIYIRGLQTTQTTQPSTAAYHLRAQGTNRVNASFTGSGTVTLENFAFIRGSAAATTTNRFVAPNAPNPSATLHIINSVAVLEYNRQIGATSCMFIFGNFLTSAECTVITTNCIMTPTVNLAPSRRFGSFISSNSNGYRVEQLKVINCSIFAVNLVNRNVNAYFVNALAYDYNTLSSGSPVFTTTTADTNAPPAGLFEDENTGNLLLADGFPTAPVINATTNAVDPDVPLTDIGGYTRPVLDPLRGASAQPVGSNIFGLRIGDTEIRQVYIGGTEIRRIYLAGAMVHNVT